MPHPEKGLNVPNHSDKLVHFGLFAVASVLWLRARPAGASPRAWRMKVLATGLALAVGTELTQGLPIIARDPDPLAALADAVGVVAAIGAMSGFERIASRRAVREDPVETVAASE